MSATDPAETTEFNRAMHERIIALGAIPVTDDLSGAEATNRLFRQLISLLGGGGGGGGGGSLYANVSIIPGSNITIASFDYGPEFAGNAFFGANAAAQSFPVSGGSPSFSIRLPGTPVAVFDIPATALAPAGWIVGASLVSGGPGSNAWNIFVQTGGGAPNDTLITFTITDGPIVLTGAIIIVPIFP